MDLVKIAQELNKPYLELLKQTYLKAYELSNDIESNEKHQNQKSMPTVKQIMAAENAFGIAANSCKDKQGLLKALQALKSFYSLVTSSVKSGVIFLDSKYARDSLQSLADSYSQLSKMI